MSNTNKEIEEEFFSLLGENQIELNPQLEQVVKYFFSSEKHFTQQDIEDYVRNKGRDITTDIINKVLQLLTEYGFARIRTFADGIDRYEHLHLNEHHDHLFCIRCKKIVEFSSNSLEQEQDFTANHFDFHPFWHKLEIYGLCNECFSKSKGTAIPLTLIHTECKVEIAEIKSGKKPPKWPSFSRQDKSGGIQRRIREMGLVSGTQVKVISNNLGMVVLEVHGQRIALGREMSQHVLVKLID